MCAVAWEGMRVVKQNLRVKIRDIQENKWSGDDCAAEQPHAGSLCLRRAQP